VEGLPFLTGKRSEWDLKRGWERGELKQVDRREERA